MCPEPPHTTRHYCGHSGRFAIVSAIFLLVILTSLGAFMVTFSTAQHTTSAQDVLGTSAAQAAQPGWFYRYGHMHHLRAVFGKWKRDNHL